MALKGNKGEWSELYAFFKLLSDGCIYCGDAYLNRYDDKFYPVLELFRDDKPDRNSYKIQSERRSIIIKGNNIDIEVPQDRFTNEAAALLALIKSKNDNTDFSHIESFMKMIDIHTVKAKSLDKADIRIVIHDLKRGSKPELGYSIKSKLGAKSSLINSNKDATNFIYRVNGISAEQMDEFNSCDNFKEKFNYLQSHDAILSYISTANNIFHNNLTLLDLGIEKIIAEALLLYYSGKSKSLSDTIKLITETDPLNIMDSTDQPMYEYKVKQFLLAFALGMTSAKPWYGQFHANGGYIIVKEDGDIICYHFFDRNDLEEYLYHNTFFDTPSTNRHNFGKIYEENGEYFLKLNLQVRFN